jgi:hypothetical protein
MGGECRAVRHEERHDMGWGTHGEGGVGDYIEPRTGKHSESGAEE